MNRASRRQSATAANREPPSKNAGIMTKNDRSRGRGAHILRVSSKGAGEVSFARRISELRPPLQPRKQRRTGELVGRFCVEMTNGLSK